MHLRSCKQIALWMLKLTRTDPRPAAGRLRVRIRSIEKSEVGNFILLHKISRTVCCFGICTHLKQCNCYESATIWYTDHQYLPPYSEIINNLQGILMFCSYAVRSCGTWRKGPGQFPCDVLSISDLELYVIERSTGVCDPATDWNVVRVRIRKPLLIDNMARKCASDIS